MSDKTITTKATKQMVIAKRIVHAWLTKDITTKAQGCIAPDEVNKLITRIAVRLP
jgi:hypothetical protein